MSYLEDIQKQINNRDFPKFLILWEEYISADHVDVAEFSAILKALKQSDFAKPFGDIVETALPLWQTITDPEGSYEILKLLVDMETKNSSQLAELSINCLQKRFATHPQFQDFLKMVGLRTKENFQGALSSFELLAHFKKGNFLFHSSGWGTGEIQDVSLLRETISVEFENVPGIKHITFQNAVKSLTLLPKTHFLARRFADPDLFERDAKNDPAEIIKLLLADLGPKTSAEIKDEMADLVIPEKEWNKWWQQAKTKLKKDTMVQVPESIQDPFVLRTAEVSHSQELFNALKKANNPSNTIQTAYAFVRDFAGLLKEEGTKEKLQSELVGLLNGSLPIPLKLQLLLFLDSSFGYSPEREGIVELLKSTPNLTEVIQQMDILAFKKRALVLIRDLRSDWAELFFQMLFTIEPSNLRDYILDELQGDETKQSLVKNLRDLMIMPEKHPEFFFWYFQQLIKEGDRLPFGDKEGVTLFLEHYLILLQKVELDPKYKDLSKKMVNLLTADRYKLIRNLIEGTDIGFIKEFLLLVSKCHTLSENDKKNFHSLAQVVHPTLAPEKKQDEYNHVIWTTEEGYHKTRNRIEQIGTVEMVENAREVEKARSYGDLRENSEYKYAIEKRKSLQAELKNLSGMLNHARILTKEDIDAQKVSIGTVVDLENEKGQKITYTILGPWDTDTDNDIISSQSKMAQAMLGLGAGEKFSFKDEQYKVLAIKSFL